MFSAVVRPFALALFQGDADPPPPRSRWLRFRLPRWQPLAGHVDLVQVADILVAYFLFATTFSQLVNWNGGAKLPVDDSLLSLASAALSLPVALRDRWPLGAWRVAMVQLPFAFWVTQTVGTSYPPYTVGLAVMYLLVTYSVAVRGDRRITVAVWVISVLTAWIVHPDSMVLVTIMVTVSLLFGYNVRVRRNATTRLAEEERRSRLAEGAQAVLEERARIARELHDVVAHHMSVIAIQAEAVPVKAAGDPALLEAGLAEIRSLSLEAIAELRQVLGVLRDQDGRTDTAPQPGLDRLDELVSNARAAGLTVLVGRPEPLGPLPPAVGLSAYRIVQESLSNAMRHSPGATVTIAVEHDGDALRLRVANGGGTAPGGAEGAGQGLVGMRERAALLGGTLEAGPVDGGGFQVTATLPIAVAATEETT
ncbi:sensor histidine kinase [Nonomuraea sp. NEAU-A123]|uniref:sensor histidine kinase n=1 Tax=Nonomuraea sp. NEAU-A123 TaxID=2839649 RepID=UPI001BE4A1A5|nr:sensor histidine kinase [Nonomuraea sp. NEAU-A123]MBT2233036.1 sensor histidine kinase [Nonomuraea sp. NEAU-A123]